LRTLDPLRLTWLYSLALGVGLLLDGALLLVLNAAGVQVSVVSGIALLAVSIGSEVRAMWAALIFGAFYVALGVLGLTISQPFGLQLGPGENAFHLTVGPLALLLGAWALRSSSLAPLPLRSAGPPAELRNAPATRPALRRRRGKARRPQRRR
jgi:hypothetical protein